MTLGLTSQQSDAFFSFYERALHRETWPKDYTVILRMLTYYRSIQKEEDQNAEDFLSWCILLFPHQWKYILDEESVIRMWKF